MTGLSTDENDHTLSQLLSGDATAFEFVVRSYSGRMLHVARRLLRNEDDAADAVQDAFLSAFKSLSQFAGNSSLSTWLHRIVINACLMKLRSRSRHKDCSLDALLPEFDRSGHHVDPPGKWPRCPDELIRGEGKLKIRACIDQLPDDYRIVLMLRDIDELDTEQTAELLGVTSGTVRTRLHRARLALRTLLEPYFMDKSVSRISRSDSQ